MANKNLLTVDAHNVQVQQVYYSSIAKLPSKDHAITTMYCFLAHIDPWNGSDEPPQPTEDQQYIKNVFKSMFAVKKISASEISPVIERIDWLSGTTYDYYQDDVNMFTLDPAGYLSLKFYVRNRYDQVFKCLWNNNRASSTQEPYFQPGTYGTNNIFTGTDGYKWKYIYSIDVGTKQKFMDESWMPIPIGSNVPNALQTPAGSGDVEVINVVNSGSGYDQTNASIKITVTGDGSGATGTAVVSNGRISDIVVTNTGSNYSYANVSIVSDLGSGASVIAPVSPIGGHGFDPISELGCSKVIITTEFNGFEGGLIPTDIDYRQIGLLVNPTALSTYPLPAEGNIYKVSTDFIASSGFGLYTNDEYVYQGNSLAEAMAGNGFFAKVLSFDSSSNIIRLINTQGTYTLNAPVFGDSSKTVRTLLGVNLPDFQSFSGHMIYIQNRTGIQRSYDGIEQFRFILGF